jgi:hypothetical protein
MSDLFIGAFKNWQTGVRKRFYPLDYLFWKVVERIVMLSKEFVPSLRLRDDSNTNGLSLHLSFLEKDREDW